jgi:hypothetical protein
MPAGSADPAGILITGDTITEIGPPRLTAPEFMIGRVWPGKANESVQVDD